MTVICEYAATCSASMYCTHARAHEPFKPWTHIAYIHKCDDRHECHYMHKMVKCVESSK